MTSSSDILILTGPTASGKSALSLSIAQRTGGVIINADSQQIYRELRILTARPSPEDEARAPHRLYGILSGDDPCSAGKWLKLARMEIDWVLTQRRLPIVVGGTGLYLKALMQGIADIPPIEPCIRTQAANDYDAMGKNAFADRLKGIDPEFFVRLEVYDRQRLLRAWEVWLSTGKSLTWWQQRGVTPPYPSARFHLYQVDLPRDELYRNCNVRFTALMDFGALEEVRHLLSLNLPPEAPVMKSLGVRELTAYLRNEQTLEEAIARAQQSTRRYAKRQLTWFRHQFPHAQVISPDASFVNGEFISTLNK